MGRDLTPLASAAPVERYGKEVHNPFDALGFRLHVDRRDGRLFHQVSFVDAQGRVVVQQEQEVQFVIGSGTRANSYLINLDGHLLESPISWFPQHQIWDLSPGFGKGYLTGRPVREPCLFCHCNQVDHVAGTDNAYRPPIFKGYSIGCERCHGPGELHVKRHGEAEVKGVDDTIVNPKKLDPVLRESVCQQCHLEGSNRILRRGKEPFDFRPGLPLHQYISVFLPSPEFGDPTQFVDQVEQMYASRCFQGSAGKLGCISCHDPHAVPAPAERVSFYRGRCLKCHEENSCSIPQAKRRQTDKEDSCVRCHMAHRSNNDIPHTITTDHRVSRNPERVEPRPAPAFELGGVPLIHFHRNLVDEHDPEVSRDLGMALMELAWASPPLKQKASELAVPLLEEAVRRWRDDTRAWQAKGKVLWVQGRQREALADLEHALEQAPRQEDVLEAAASMATGLGEDEKALAYWQRAQEVNPWKALNHIQMAQLWAKRQEWQKVRNECQEALRLDPFHVETRLLQIKYWLQAGNREQARAALQTVLALQPARAEELRRWFAEQTR
jgi:Tfp pilus assembly protein PilF